MQQKHASTDDLDKKKDALDASFWLGHKDSNLGMSGPKPDALPLGYTPWTMDMISRDMAYVNPLFQSF